MMTPTNNINVNLTVASASQQGFGGSHGVTGKGQPTDVQSPPHQSPVTLQAKEGQAAQYRLRHFNRQVNAIAKSLRTDDQALGKMETLLNKAERPLSNIVKSFPPYPVGSEERVKLLKSFSSYRKMIDKLTVPPVNDQMSELGAYEPLSSKERIFTLGADHPGGNKKLFTEVEIPGLPNDADDPKIEAVQKKINDAKVSIIERRAKIFEKAAEIKKMLHQGHPYGESIEQQLGISRENGDLDVDPVGLSRHIKDDLLSAPAGYMHTDRSVMIDML